MFLCSLCTHFNGQMAKVEKKGTEKPEHETLNRNKKKKKQEKKASRNRIRNTVGANNSNTPTKSQIKYKEIPSAVVQ